MLHSIVFRKITVLHWYKSHSFFQWPFTSFSCVSCGRVVCKTENRFGFGFRKTEPSRNLTSVETIFGQKLRAIRNSNYKLEGHSVECIYLRQRCSHGLRWTKPHLTAAVGSQYLYLGFSRRNKIPRCSTYTILEKAIRFGHPDYNPDRALISSSMSHVICWHATFHPNPCTRFWVILLRDRQTDRRTRAKTFTSSFVGGKNNFTCI